ncbi:putative lipoprotein, partial [Yersinia pestis PY-12]
MHCLMNALF